MSKFSLQTAKNVVIIIIIIISTVNKNINIIVIIMIVYSNWTGQRHP